MLYWSRELSAVARAGVGAGRSGSMQQGEGARRVAF